jgi:DNA helicase-2/ATP-dependent DNA helicase PcrA
MTVRQAKGLEWNKVIVSLIPNKRFDSTDLEQMYSTPQILQETPAEEFTRMYYVACSRAKEELYIHLPDDANLIELLKIKIDHFITTTNSHLNYKII